MLFDSGSHILPCQGTRSGHLVCPERVTFRPSAILAAGPPGHPCHGRMCEPESNSIGVHGPGQVHGQNPGPYSRSQTRASINASARPNLSTAQIASLAPFNRSGDITGVASASNFSVSSASVIGLRGSPLG
jgi:hypothetical protein